MADSGRGVALVNRWPSGLRLVPVTGVKKAMSSPSHNGVSSVHNSWLRAHQVGLAKGFHPWATTVD